MKRTTLLTAGALILGGAAFAQHDATGELEAVTTTTFSGVYHVATGVWQYGAQPEGPLGDVIFNNTAPTGFFDGGMSGANTYIDEGRVPSLSSAAPVGTQNSYTITAMEFSYCTRELEVGSGGAGAHFVLGIIDKFAAGCAGLGVSVPPTVYLDISGAPASTAAGTLSCHTVLIDLTGLGLCISADGEGAFGGGDLFGYTMQFLPTVAGSTGAMIAGDPAVVADDTVFTTGGVGTGSGLDAQDLFFREGDGTAGKGCLFFGGYPANPFASHYFKLYGDSTGGECANCPNDDRYDNPLFGSLGDTCGVAIDLVGDILVENLTANGPDEDFFRVTVPNATQIDVLALFSNAQGDIDMRLWDASCTTQLDGSFSVTDNEDVTYVNTSGGDIDVTIEVYAWPAGSSSDCADYDLAVSLSSVTPCGADDVFEDNDSCVSAAPIGAGLTTGLEAVGSDLDYYSFTVAHGETVTAIATFLHAQADLDMNLFNADCSSQLDSSGSVSNSEVVTWSNLTGAPVTVRIEMFIWPEGTGTGCGNYDLDVSTTLYGNYCTPVANSTGFPALMSYTGSLSLGTNNFTLQASPVPNEMYVFFYGPTQVQVPFGDGNRCVGTPLQRLSPPALAAGNLATRNVNLAFYLFTPGSVNFQCWHRDTAAGGSGWNTSDGLEAVFIP
jgi:hypothetical protein